jgi:hypothetical protein
MTEDLEEIKERLEQLERYLNLLETRVDLQESLMRLYSAGRRPIAPSDAEDAQSIGQVAQGTLPSADAPELKGFDYLLRSILTHQGMHNTDIRKAVRSQQGPRSSMDSIEQVRHDIHRKVQILVNEREAS